MNWHSTESNLRFERRSLTALYRLIAVAVTLGVFTLLWVIMPFEGLYWLLLLLVGLSTWIATYGWRGATIALISALTHLERSQTGG